MTGLLLVGVIISWQKCHSFRCGSEPEVLIAAITEGISVFQQHAKAEYLLTAVEFGQLGSQELSPQSERVNLSRSVGIEGIGVRLVAVRGIGREIGEWVGHDFRPSFIGAFVGWSRPLVDDFQLQMGDTVATGILHNVIAGNYGYLRSLPLLKCDYVFPRCSSSSVSGSGRPEVDFGLSPVDFVLSNYRDKNGEIEYCSQSSQADVDKECRAVSRGWLRDYLDSIRLSVRIGISLLCCAAGLWCAWKISDIRNGTVMVWLLLGIGSFFFCVPWAVFYDLVFRCVGR